jgi:hypothetical protein
MVADRDSFVGMTAEIQLTRPQIKRTLEELAATSLAPALTEVREAVLKQ